MTPIQTDMWAQGSSRLMQWPNTAANSTWPDPGQRGPRPTPPSLLVSLVEELQCASQLRTIRKLHGKRLRQLQPLPYTLGAWALLQLDGPPRLCRAASEHLARAAASNKSFREKVERGGEWAVPCLRVSGGGR